MTGHSFLDTNVLVYAFDEDEPVKATRARELLASDDARRYVISGQVLSEFHVTVTRKLRRALTASEARLAVAEYAELPVVAIDRHLVLAAIDTAEQHQLSYWDALIIEAATTAGCDRVLTEDMNAGATIRGVEIVNPFE